jgi:cytoskeletal protein RodZ
MTPEPTPNERARRLRAERRSRITTIRKRVAVVSLTAFIALFSTIYIQMAAGHDPALAQKSKSTTTTSHQAKTPSTSSSTSSSTTSDATPDGTGSNSQVAPAPAPAPVTTGQS